MDELASIAWWQTQSIEFGVIPEAPPDPNPPASPSGYKELAVGTLDGRVTAVLALHDAWSHSYVSGPYGTDVLVANDLGATSEVFIVSAIDGSRRDLFVTDGIVAAAALGDDGRSIYYVELDRGSLRSTGVHRRWVAGGPPEVVLDRDITGDSPNEPIIYWITADPLDDRVVAQWCFGQVTCTSYLIDTRDGSFASDNSLGWPIGASPAIFFGDGLGSSANARAWSTGSGEVEPITGASRSVPVPLGGGWRFVRDETGVPEGRTVTISPDGTEAVVPGADPELTTIGQLGERRGVALPPGWALRWPSIELFSGFGNPPPPTGPPQLLHVETGQRVALPDRALHVTEGAGCDVPVPSAMPDGRPIGLGVLMLLDGRRTIRWGSGDDRVVLDVGVDALNVAVGEPIRVRGSAGRLALVGDEGVGEVAFTWSEDGCDHTVWLPPGTTLELARDYASRY